MSWKFLRNGTREQLGHMIDGIYLPRALAGHFDQNSEELRRKIKADGILPLLEDDLGLLADAAAVSLCTPLDHKLEVNIAFSSLD